MGLGGLLKHKMVGTRAFELRGRYDVTMFVAMTALVVLGTLLVFSTTGLQSLRAKESVSPLTHQLLTIAAGLMSFIIAIHIPVRWFKTLAVILLPISIAMLVAVLFAGEARLGARRWFRLGQITLQPSEIAKVAFALYLARYLEKRRDWLHALGAGIAPLGIVFCVLALLIGLQPDVGSVALLAALLIAMLIAGGARISFLGIALLIAVIALLSFILLQPEKVARFIGWLMPEATRMGEGYHIYNSQILFGAGGLWGSGLGEGIHHQLGYIPQSSNDFIFSVAAEELGFIGVVCIVLLYAAIAIRGFMLVRICQDDFSRFAVFALTLILTLPAFVHMAVDLGMLPTKGLVCPGLSSGGTAMVATMGTLGMLERFHLEATAVKVEDEQ